MMSVPRFFSDPPRSSSGQRRYRGRDLAWLTGLVMLRGTGMSIAEIREVVALARQDGTEGEMLAVFEQHRQRVMDQLAQTQRYLAAIDKKIAAYRAAAAERS
jgi:DNA-binding transcriptional MerR regulator